MDATPQVTVTAITSDPRDPPAVRPPADEPGCPSLGKAGRCAKIHQEGPVRM